MKKFYLILLTLSIGLLLSCGELFLTPDPENTPENNFQILWQDFDKHYSRFDYKGVNWDSLYSIYRPQVNSNTTGMQLFNIMASMLSNLRDSHVRIESPDGIFYYRRTVYLHNFDINIVQSNYLENTKHFSIFTYGQLADNLGYIHINSFMSNKDNYEFIDNIVRYFVNYKGIVIDVRDNGGGNSFNAELISGRFCDKERLYACSKFKNGPDHNDFTELFPAYISPKGNQQLIKPIALLTNRYSGSATEDFISMMMVFPYVRLVGDTTNGSIGGHPITRELPNGWIYRMSTGRFYSNEYISYEGVGIPPDIAVTISETDSLSGIDTILETAIQILK